MCFLGMSFNLSQHEPRPSEKHKHHTAKCITQGNLTSAVSFDNISPEFHPKGFYSYKKIT